MKIKSTEKYRVFPYADSYVSKGLSSINIRIANRANRNQNINIPVYLTNGQRLKANPATVEGGQIKGNPDANLYLDNLTNQIINYISTAKSFNKKVIEKLLFGDGFLDQHKQKRTRTIEIPQYTYENTPTFNSYRQKYFKERTSEQIITVDDQGFKLIQEKEIILDPLSLEDFPKNFDKDLFEKFYQEYLLNGGEKFDTLETQPDQTMLELNNAWVIGDLKEYIEKKFYSKKMSGSITINKGAIDQYEKENLKIRYANNGKAFLAQFHKRKLIDIQKKRDISNLSSTEIYTNGLWDKSNIFEMFGSIYYDSNVPATYQKILLRFLEYREIKKPSEDIKDLNARWLIDFFLFLKEEGFYRINTAGLDPLKYDPSIFYQDKPKEQYKPKSLNKMIGITKTLINGADKFSFYKKGFIPKLDLSDLKLSAITDEKDVDGTRIEHNLTKNELDELFWFEFDKKKLKQYQDIFDEKNKSKNITIGIADLNTAKQLFILQVMFGGLRGYRELHTAKLLKHDKNEFKVTFYQNKVNNTVTNPLNDYTDKILKPLGYQLPKLKRDSAIKKDQVITNVDILESYYRALVQTIGEIINFDRSVLVDGVKFIHQPIKEIFNPYFSRKTFGTILSNELRLNDAEIGLFTGHKERNQSELSSSYIQKNTIENKKKLLEKLKVGKK